MPLPGDALAAFADFHGLPVHRAAGVVWHEPAPGLLEPLPPHVALDGELRNISLLLQLTGKRQARFPSAHAVGISSAAPLVWRPNGVPVARPAADIVPLTSWQLPDPRYAPLVAHHHAWSALGLFDNGALISWLVLCEDDGWLHEAACSRAGDVDALRRHAQWQVTGAVDLQGMTGGPAHLGFVPSVPGWRSLRRRLWPFP